MGLGAVVLELVEKLGALVLVLRVLARGLFQFEIDGKLAALVFDYLFSFLICLRFAGFLGLLLLFLDEAFFEAIVFHVLQQIILNSHAAHFLYR